MTAVWSGRDGRPQSTERGSPESRKAPLFPAPSLRDCLIRECKVVCLDLVRLHCRFDQSCASVIERSCVPLSSGLLCSRDSRRPLRGWRQTAVAPRARQHLAQLGRQRGPEPRPARESPPAASARPRKNRRRKTNVLFCNIRRARVSECVVHLLIFEKGDDVFSLLDWANGTLAPTR